jgi:hypothetical protein
MADPATALAFQIPSLPFSIAAARIEQRLAIETTARKIDRGALHLVDDDDNPLHSLSSSLMYGSPPDAGDGDVYSLRVPCCPARPEGLTCEPMDTKPVCRWCGARWV